MQYTSSPALQFMRCRLNRRGIFFLITLGSVMIVPILRASEGAGVETTAGHGISYTILWIALILLAAKFGGLVERFGQPSVLGELVVGVILGNIVLLGLDVFEPIKADGIISFLAELGVIILLFQIGLESNIQKMKSVGIKAFLVATV